MNLLRPFFRTLLLPAMGGLLLGLVTALVLTAAMPRVARAQEAADTNKLSADAVQLALRSVAPGTGLRVAVEAGTLDPRLKLAPCQKAETYLPPGFTPWGRTRVGLRCVQGASRWNVYLPLTVKVYGTALVAAAALPVGALLTAADLRETEIDLAADRSPAVTVPDEAVGRHLTRALAPGDSLRQADLRARQWFAAGDTVRVVAVGEGFAVHSEGQAITPGLDGSAARVRIDNGRIVSGRAVGERRVELKL